MDDNLSLTRREFLVEEKFLERGDADCAQQEIVGSHSASAHLKCGKRGGNFRTKSFLSNKFHHHSEIIGGHRIEPGPSGSSFRNQKIIILTLFSQTLFIIISILFSLPATNRSESWNEFGVSQQALDAASLPIKFNFASARLAHNQDNRAGLLAGGPRQSSSPLARKRSDTDLSAYRYELGPREGAIVELARGSANQSEQNDDENDLSAIRLQIETLRRKLDSKRWMRLGSPCLHSNDCNRFILKSHCRSETSTCSCLPQFVEFNSTTCLAPSLLGYECSIDAQCTAKVANSHCDKSGHCACLPNDFIAFRKEKCLEASEINQYCLLDKQCHLADKHSYCKWKIPNVYGVCKCPPNYLIIEKESSSNGTNKFTRCAPRLGDSCLSNQECQLATENSICREPSAPAGHWRTSAASKSKCHCQAGFSESKNRMHCSPTQTEPQQQLEAREQKIAFELLERGKLSEYNNFMDSLQLDGRNFVKLATRPAGEQQSINQTNFYRNSSLSSLGKRCSSNSECQMRDKFSHCLNGHCECLRPSKKCSSKATGCHANTFQCRNGQCISWYFVCDSHQNCDDGSDEEACLNFHCPPETFQCKSSGQCLTLSSLCDGKRDCSDGSDELDCNSSHASARGPPLVSKNFNEGVNPFEPSRIQWNNTNYQSINSTCHPKAFTCNNGQCLPGYVFCNAIEECSDGSDESRDICQGRPAAGGLLPDLASQTDRHQAAPDSSQLQRDSLVVKVDKSTIEELLKRRLPNNRVSQLEQSRGRPGPRRSKRSSGAGPERRLDRRRHAKLDPQFQSTSSSSSSGSGSDSHSSPDLVCPIGSFACRNGRCRSNAILCSGVDGCGDNSDEDRCQVCQCEPI